MRKKLLLLAVVAITGFLNSCNIDDDNTGPTFPVAEDDYYLVVANTAGELYQVGNNTGEVTASGLIASNIATEIRLTNYVNTEDFIYGMIYDVTAENPNRLLLRNKNILSTTTEYLSLPETIPGEAPGITAMAVNETVLYALVNENINAPTEGEAHLVSIDTEMYAVTDLGITVPNADYTGMLYRNNALYISTLESGLHLVDFDTNSVSELTFNGASVSGGRLTFMDDTHLAMYRVQQSGENNVANYVELDLSNMSINNALPNQIFSLANVYGIGANIDNTFYAPISYETNGAFYPGYFQINYTNSTAGFTYATQDIGDVIVLDTEE